VSGSYHAHFVEPMTGYERRRMCESANSAISRTMGSTLRVRKENTLFTKSAIKAAAYASRCRGASRNGLSRTEQE